MADVFYMATIGNSTFFYGSKAELSFRKAKFKFVKKFLLFYMDV